MTALEKQQHELILACRVILQEIVEENHPLSVAREIAILEQIEELMEQTSEKQ